MTLNGQTALVAGGGRGLGRAYSRALAEAAAAVAVTARSQQEIETGSAYCVSKVALIRLTESVALEAGACGVAVFAIDPGTVRTPLSEHATRSELIGQRAPDVQGYFRWLDANDQFTPIEQSVELELALASGKADALSGCFISVDDNLDGLISQATNIQEEGRQKLRLHP